MYVCITTKILNYSSQFPTLPLKLHFALYKGAFHVQMELFFAKLFLFVKQHQPRSVTYCMLAELRTVTYCWRNNCAL